MTAAWIGALSTCIWVYLLAARGRFWQMTSAATDVQLPLSSAPPVAVVVPARNEADVIGRSVQSLLEQDYVGRLHIFVVDDHSSDGTASVVRKAAADKDEQLTVTWATPLPTGWTGKMWALAQGVERAAEFNPTYFLFTDADIVHAPDSITCLVARAQTGNLDLVSLMALLRCSSLAERTLIRHSYSSFYALSAEMGERPQTRDSGSCRW